MKVLVLNGPNLGRLGRRQPEIYGTTTHADLVELCAEWGRDLGLEVEVRQTNHEGELLDWLNQAADDDDPGRAQRGGVDALLLALLDACAQLTAPLVEVHISDPKSRPEEFRHHSVVTAYAAQEIIGQGIDGYRQALEFLGRSEVSAAPERRSRSFTHVGPGTPAIVWRRHPEWGTGAPIELGGVRRLVVLAESGRREPRCRRAGRIGDPGQGIGVEIVCATDGEGSHPDSPTHTPEDGRRPGRGGSTGGRAWGSASSTCTVSPCPTAGRRSTRTTSPAPRRDRRGRARGP